jgi:hypothetical protein
MAFRSVEDVAAYLEGIASKTFESEGVLETTNDPFAEFVNQYQSTTPAHPIQATNLPANTTAYSPISPATEPSAYPAPVSFANPLPNPFIVPTTNPHSQFRAYVDVQFELQQQQETPFAQPLQNIPHDNFQNFNVAQLPSISPNLPPSHSFAQANEKKPSKSRKVDFTKLFQTEFQALLKEKDAKVPLPHLPPLLLTFPQEQWKTFRRGVETKCTHAWCIRVKIAFCKKYGREFLNLLQDTRFRGLGSRTDCGCKLPVSVTQMGDSISINKKGIRQERARRDGDEKMWNDLEALLFVESHNSIPYDLHKMEFF